MQALLIANLGYSTSIAAHVGPHAEIQTLSRLIQQDPVNSKLYVSRGEEYRLHGNRENAITDFSKALAFDPNNIAATTGLARIYLDRGNHRQAIVHLNRTLAHEPRNVRALILRAQAYMETGRPLIAAIDYTHAIEQSRKQGKPLPDYYLKRARAYEAAGNEYTKSALLGLDEGIKLLGNIRSLELHAVELEIILDDYDAALARLNSMLARATRKESLLLKRGDILSTAGDSTAATQDYLAARAAIYSLPVQRRHNVSIMQLQHDLDARLANHETRENDD